MQEFARGYVLILAIVIGFSGFWYVRSFLYFFGMGEVLLEVDIQYVSQFSFAVLREILTSFDEILTTSFLILAASLIFLFLTIYDVNILGKLAKRFFNIESIPSLPSGISIAIYASLLLVFMHKEAEHIGRVHACNLIKGNVVNASTVEIPGHQEEVLTLFGHDKNSGTSPPVIFEVWRNPSYIYLAKKTDNCDGHRMVVKVASSEFTSLIINL